jgi:hypothetical protein
VITSFWQGFTRSCKGYDQTQLAGHKLGWKLEQLAFVILGFFATLIAQRQGWLDSANWRPVAKTLGARYTGIWATAAWLTYPTIGAFAAFLFLGPKQTRPIYRRIKGAMFRYGTVNVDRNAGCRGGRITGSTGSGKSQICINPRNHSLCINEGGVEKPTWAKSKAAAQLKGLRETHRRQTKNIALEIDILRSDRDKLRLKIDPIEDEIIAELYQAIQVHQIANPKATFTAMVLGSEAAAQSQPAAQLLLRKSNTKISTDDVVRLLQWARAANTTGQLGDMSFIPPGKLKTKLARYGELITQDNELDARINLLYYSLNVKRNDLQTFANTTKALRYQSSPFGALVIGAKGNEWQTVCPMLEYYDRDEDICLLQTRPNKAPENWTPPAKFNLISYDNLPAVTYGQLLFQTYASISNKTDMDYFDNSARDMIGYGIELMRALRDAQMERSPPVPEEQRVNPNLSFLCDLLSDQEYYDTCLRDLGALERRVKTNKLTTTRSPEGLTKTTPVEYETVTPPTLVSDRLAKVLSQIGAGYWGLAKDTQKSVMGSIRNVLVPFTEGEIAEVFCDINTVDMRELEDGKIFCVAMPPKYLVQRQFIATILKNLVFTLVNERFALEESDRRWKNRNLILVDSDEHQKSAGKEDACVDIIRQAQGSLYGATQMVDSLFKSYGSKEIAMPIIENLRNIWVCQAASDACAELSANTIGKILAPERSYAKKGGGSTSYRERHIVSPAQLRALSPFHVYWVPAEGKWLYQKLIVMPVTPDARVPFWWFGDWNLLHWVFAAISLPPKVMGIKLWSGKAAFLPPWRAKAPFAAQWRYLLGKDGTFIVLDQMTRKKAEKLAAPKS